MTSSPDRGELLRRAREGLAQDQLLRLGARLAARGVVPPGELEELLPSVASARELGDLLVAKGILTPDRLRELLREAESESIAAPSLLSRYERIGLLGEGAMALVYEAVDRQLDRRVALKLPKDRTLIGPDARERFLREARAAARMSHPNIVAVHDAGEEEGQLFLVMERVDGEAMSAILSRGPADAGICVEWIEKIARALHHVHGQGIVHRDLKPGNILVTKEGEPKVADFGLAHWVGSEAALTKSGSPVGTPMYMAPEQVTGRSREISPRTDVYALGAILYEAAVGRPPFVGQHLTEIYAKILDQPPVAPRAANSRVARDLETIILKAMEKRPEDRYASALDLADDLARFRRGEPIQAKPPGPAGRLVRWALRRKERVAVGVAASLLLALVVLLGASWSRQRSAAKAREEATRLLEAGRDWEIKGSDDKAEECYRLALKADRGFAAARYRLGRILLIRAYLETVTFDVEPGADPVAEAGAPAGEAAELIESALASRSGIEDELQRRIAAAWKAYARKDAEAFRRVAEPSLREFQGRDGIEELHWLSGLGSQGKARREAYDEAIRLRPNFSLALFSRGNARMEDGDPAGAAADYTAAIQVHPGLALAFLNRGVARSRTGNVDGAISDYGHALSAGGRVSFHARMNRGILRDTRAEFEPAAEDFSEASRLAPRSPLPYVFRAQTRQHQGDWPKTVADLEKALEVAPPDWSKREYFREVLRQARQKLDSLEH